MGKITYVELSDLVISIKNKSWSTAGVHPGLFSTALSLDTHTLCYMDEICINFAKDTNAEEEVPACVAYHWTLIGMTWKKSNLRRVHF